MNSLEISEEAVLVEGIERTLKCLRFKDVSLVIEGKFLRVARLRDEWCDDLSNPEAVIIELREMSGKPDLLTFWQRLPETTPIFNYQKEWVTIAAIPITTFKNWWTKQINDKTRNMARRAEKKGVEIRAVELNDDLIKGIMGIFNESAVKRGKRFRHYGKDFGTVKKEMTDLLEISKFIGAFLNGELIGFIKLICNSRFAMTTVILAMMKHRDKAVTNGLLAKAVEICGKEGIPFLTYTTWRKGSMGDFQKHNGFEKFQVPRYYIPLTAKGWLALRFGLHKGIREVIPERVVNLLKVIRKKWYAVRHFQLDGNN